MKNKRETGHKCTVHSFSGSPSAGGHTKQPVGHKMLSYQSHRTVGIVLFSTKELYLPLCFLSGDFTVSSEVTLLLSVKSRLRYQKYLPGPILDSISDEALSEKA